MTVESGFTPKRWAYARFEGTALTYVTRPERRITLKTISGAASLALRCGVAAQELERCIEHVATTAYQPNSDRLEQARHLVASLRS